MTKNQQQPEEIEEEYEEETEEESMDFNNTSWEVMERTFDNIDNLKERLYYLRTIVATTHICDNLQCLIFPNLSKYKIRIKDLDRYGFYSVKDAVKITNNIDRTRFINLCEELDMESEKLLSEIYALYATKSARNMEHQKKLQEYLDTLDKINNNQFPMPLQVQTGTQRKLDEIASGVDILDRNDPILQQKRLDFERQMKMSQKEKEQLLQQQQR